MTSARIAAKCTSSTGRKKYQVREKTMTKPKPAPTITAIYGFDRRSELKRPLFACGVSAGFPSPAEDYIEGRLDLNELMVANPGG